MLLYVAHGHLVRVFLVRHNNNVHLPGVQQQQFGPQEAGTVIE